MQEEINSIVMRTMNDSLFDTDSLYRLYVGSDTTKNLGLELVRKEGPTPGLSGETSSI
jgi:hypothetical protein